MRRTGIGIIRHLVAAAALSACTLTAIPALAEFKGLEIIAPANSGGGYDQHARALCPMRGRRSGPHQNRIGKCNGCNNQNDSDGAARVRVHMPVPLRP